MASKGPKTLRGMERKMMTGDGRKSTPTEKVMKGMDKTAKEAQEMLFGKQKKTTKKRRNN
jgi:hypothetical protein